MGKCGLIFILKVELISQGGGHMSITISILADDRVTKSGFIAEHGFSAFVKTDDEAFLFDAGQGMVLHHNARMMGINLCDNENVILSHGHYDHANGVRMLYCNSKIRIYSHPVILQSRFKKTAPDEYKNIGIEWLDNAVVTDKIEWNLSEQPQVLSGNLVLSGQIPRITDFEASDEPFYILNEQRRYEPDEILDDQALFISTKLGIIIVTGCAHSGLVNTVLHARKVLNQDKIHAIVGGTHLLHASTERLAKTVQFLQSAGVDLLYAGHCTGFEPACYLKSQLKEKYSILEVGLQIVFDAV
jgi:7,8-dihydropterin-6-yl-methyl-4-(beta-D-ribofuranosyl)aminobenzene 5'-phosphate synthase